MYFCPDTFYWVVELIETISDNQINETSTSSESIIYTNVKYIIFQNTLI
jgi:hypothetical protein